MMENLIQKLVAGLTLLGSILNPATTENYNSYEIEPEIQTINWADIGEQRHKLSHRQMVWVIALEWCESQGKGIEAINPKDLDNTPSYYHFQWKPDTFKGFAIKYKLLRNDLEDVDYFNWMSDYDLQYETISRMIGDKNITDKIWRFQLFPGCIKKLGLPPKI